MDRKFSQMTDSLTTAENYADELENRIEFLEKLLATEDEINQCFTTGNPTDMTTSLYNKLIKQATVRSLIDDN